MKRAGASIVAAAAIAAASASASAETTHSWEGTCRLSGEFTFTPTLGDVLQQDDYAVVAEGTCNGRLDGVAERSLPTVLRISGTGLVSCLADDSRGVATTTFELPNGGEVTLHLVTRANGALTQFITRFRGTQSGRGVAHASFIEDETPAAVAACGTGTLASARYRVMTRTLTKIVG